MDINKIHDAMKVLKEECKKYKQCEDCIFFNNQNDAYTRCYLGNEPDRWEEDKIVENNCTTVTLDADEWYGLVLKCDNCDEEFMLGGFDREHIVDKFCPHCGKKIINYKEESK